MEPIQDDIETLRRVLEWVRVQDLASGSVAGHNARRGKEAFDRLVAERDRLRIAYEQAHAVTAAVEAERDRLLADKTFLNAHRLEVIEERDRLIQEREQKLAEEEKL